MHPHSAEKYAAMWESMVRLRKPVIYRGNWGVVLQSSIKELVDDRLVYAGVIAKFMVIDQTLDWYNVNTFEEASAGEIQNINVPDHLKPNLSTFRYIFLPSTHKLIFESKSGNKILNPNALAKVLTVLVSSPDIDAEYGRIDVNTIKDERALEKILRMPMLQKLRIKVDRPNDDDIGSFDEDFMRELDRQNVQRVEYDYTAERGESIKPDEQVLKIAELANRYGHVDAVGKDSNGAKLVESTKEHPKRVAYIMDPKIEDVGQVLKRSVTGR
jgi:hypothetical protein